MREAMMRILRPLIAAAVALVLTTGTAPAIAQEETGASQDNAAVAINTRDGTTVVSFSFRIVRVTGDVVNAQNVAFAWSSCAFCKTVAAAFQVVLVFSDPSVVSPENYAIAVNFECTSCETLASAYQWVLGDDGVVVLTPEGSKALAEIRQQLPLLAQQADTLSLAEIQAELDALAAQVEEILANELVVAGPGPITWRALDLDEGEEAGEPTEAPTPVETPADGETETTSPTPIQSPTQTPLPTESPTSTPSETVSPTP
jgi:putative peptide zinc metalloprotease protein